MESYEWEKSLESDDIEHFQKLFHLMNNTQRTTAFILGGEKNCFKVVKFLLRECSLFDSEFLEICRNTILTKWKSFEMMKLLIHSNKIDIKQICIWIFYFGRLDDLKYMISELKLDPHKPLEYDRTPFWFACAENRVEMAKYLYEEHKVDVNLRCDGYTALWIACFGKRLEMVKYLITLKEIDLNIRNDMDESPLWLSTLSCSVEIVKCLVAAGANFSLPNNMGKSPLLISLETKNMEIVKCLVEAGADLYQADPRGMTPIEYAKTNNIDIEQYLSKSTS